MGDKIQARKIAKENGLPVIEGSEGGVSNIVDAKEKIKEIKNYRIRLRNKRLKLNQ